MHELDYKQTPHSFYRIVTSLFLFYVDQAIQSCADALTRAEPCGTENKTSILFQLLYDVSKHTIFTRIRSLNQNGERGR
jgi:hypothetical protein